MKKLLLTFILIGMVLPLCACTPQTQELRDPVAFYYPRQDIVYNETDGVLAPEFREGAGMKDDAAALLQLYLSGPQDSTLRTPFPAGLRIITVNRTGKTLYLTLSHDLANLSGLELTVACASLTKTCMALTGVSAVQIRAQGGALLDGAGYIYMDESNLLLLDSGGQKK
jgi:hypothetical protein